MKEEDPHSIMVEKAMPAVAERLRTFSGIVQTGLTGLDARLGSMEEKVRSCCCFLLLIYLY